MSNGVQDLIKKQLMSAERILNIHDDTKIQQDGFVPVSNLTNSIKGEIFPFEGCLQKRNGNF